MRGLYTVIANPYYAEFLTIITFGLFCLGLLSFLWGNAKQLNKRLSGFQWFQIYFLGTLTFLSIVIFLGKLIVPTNAENLLELLRIDGILRAATSKFQIIMLSIIKPLM